MTDQQEARENAARELAKRLEHVTSLADPLAFARDYWTDATAHGWRYLPRPAVATAAGTGTPPEAHADELQAVRDRCAAASHARQEAALTRKDHHDA